MMSVPHPGCFHRRLLFSELGPFDETFHIATDYEFLLRELPAHDASFVPGVVIADVETGGISNTSWRASLLEARRAARAHGWPGIPWLNLMCYCALRSGVVALVGPAGWSRLRRLTTRALRRHDDEDAG
jgi:hypothetical protein